MASSELKIEPILASQQEQIELAKLEKVLEQFNNGDRTQLPRIVSPTGEEIDMPVSVLRLLHQLVPQLAKGKGVMSWTFHQPLTIEEAAALLNFPRLHLVKLLKDGEIPSAEVEIERRIQFDDLMTFKKRWEELRHQTIVEIAQMSQEAGLYFTEREPTNQPTNTPAQ